MPTFETRVNANTHDGAYQESEPDPNIIWGGGSLLFGSSNVAANRWNSVVHYGSVPIPQGATIDVAFLRFVARNADATTVIRTNVYGVDEDNTAPALTVGNAKGKALTAAIAWDNIPAWAVDEDGPDTQTVDIAAAVQTIVGRAGWASGNAMQFHVRDDGSDLANRFRRAFSHDTTPAKACLVHIEYSGPGTVLRSFPSPTATPFGLTWDGRSLWHCETSGPTIYQIDPRDGTIQRSFAAPATRPLDLAWSGRALWLIDDTTNLIYLLDPANGDILRSFTSPATQVLGITFGGGSLWTADAITSLIYQIDPRDGTIQRSFAAPAVPPRALAWDGRYLWHCNNLTALIFQINPRTGTIVRSFIAPGTAPIGVAFDGRTIWVCDLATDLIYQLSLQ